MFIGRVTALTGGVQFEVERAILGVSPGRIRLENGPGECGLEFKLGARYFVYARRDRFTGTLTTGMCTRTLPLSDPHARADLAYFTRRQHRWVNRPLLTGVVRDMTYDLVAPRLFDRPIAGIRITAAPFDGGPPRVTTTHADGSYAFTRIRTGRYSITARLPAQFERLRPFTVTVQDDRDCAAMDVEARIDGRISGQLLDEQGQPLPRTVLHLADPAQARVAPSLRTIDVQTDDQGYFEFRDISPGRYVVGVNLRTPLLHRRQFYSESLDPMDATIVELKTAERRQLPPFRATPLADDRLINIVVQAPTNEAARETGIFMTGPTPEFVAQISAPVRFRLPFGASYLIEAVPPTGYRVIPPRAVRIASDDTDKTIEFRVATP